MNEVQCTPTPASNLQRMQEAMQDLLSAVSMSEDLAAQVHSDPRNEVKCNAGISGTPGLGQFLSEGPDELHSAAERIRRSVESIRSLL